MSRLVEQFVGFDLTDDVAVAAIEFGEDGLQAVVAAAIARPAAIGAAAVDLAAIDLVEEDPSAVLFRHGAHLAQVEVHPAAAVVVVRVVVETDVVEVEARRLGLVEKPHGA